MPNTRVNHILKHNTILEKVKETSESTVLYVFICIDAQWFKLMCMFVNYADTTVRKKQRIQTDMPTVWEEFIQEK